MDKPDLQDRRRESVGKITQDYGRRTMGELRAVYGEDFAPGFGDDSRLGSIVLLLDQSSLTRLLADQDAGMLSTRLGDL